MKDRLLAGAILLLAFGLILNALALFFSPAGRNPVLPTVMAQGNNQVATPPLFYLGSDTYFLTQSSDGATVYLWHYNHSPLRRDNQVEFVTRATSPQR